MGARILSAGATRSPGRGFSRLIGRTTGRLREAWYGSAPYQWRLGGARTTQLLFSPQDPWPGSSERGQAIVSGAIRFADEPVYDAPFVPVNPHDFRWLRDLRATGTEAARRRGRELIRDWIAANGRFDPASWETPVLAERLVNWQSHYDYFCRNADNAFKAAFFRSLVRQSRHLSRVARATTRGAGRVKAAKGMIYAGACLPGGHGRFERGLALLEAAVQAHVYPDGGIWERSPSRQLDMLRDLVDVRAVLAAAHRDPSPVIQTAIDRIAPMVRFFRHGDGKLALFHHSFEEEDWAIDVVLNQSGAKGKAPQTAPHSGFQRLSAGRTVLIADTGAPPPPGYDDAAHAGLLAFEMSIGRERLVVNCGAYFGTDPAWREAGRMTAAHSTLVVDDTNAAPLIEGDGLGRLPHDVACQRIEEDGHALIDARHDGYARRHGLIHRRRLYMARGGEDIRGEDSLQAARTGGTLNAGKAVAIRFHLHPDVKVETLSMWEGGAQYVEVRLPREGAWAFHTHGDARLDVEDSFYLGEKGVLKPTRQIVILAETEAVDVQTIKWSIRRSA